MAASAQVREGSRKMRGKAGFRSLTTALHVISALQGLPASRWWWLRSELGPSGSSLLLPLCPFLQSRDPNLDESPGC